MIQVLVLGLHLPHVHADRSNWSDELDPQGEFVAGLSRSSGELQAIEAEEDASKGHDGWEQINFSIAVLGDQEVAAASPDSKGQELMRNNSGVCHWIVRDPL